MGRVGDARYYDPQTGQFLTVDPLVDWTEQTYAYGSDDPVDRVDPSGGGAVVPLDHPPRYELCPHNESIIQGLTSLFNYVREARQKLLSWEERHSDVLTGVQLAVILGGGDFVADGAAGGVGDSLVDLTPGESWGNSNTLEQHFSDHGSDFGATSASEYASDASEFLQKGVADGLPTKIASDGTIRVYDPSTNTFGAYTAQGLTKTFFKPSSPTYFARQPGTLVP